MEEDLGGRIAELVIDFDGWVRRVPLGRKPLVLGRSKDCDLQLVDPKLSRRHCQLLPAEAGGWLVEDLGSQGGTLVGGVPVQAPTPLRPGDRVQIGSMEMRLELRPALSMALSEDGSRGGRNVELLLQTVGDLYGTNGLGELLRTIVDGAIMLAGGDRGALLLASASGALEAGIARDAAGRDLEPDQTLARALPGQALESGRAMVLTGAPAPEQKDRPPTSVLETRPCSVLCVPLPGSAGPAGVLYVDGHRPAEEFSPAELATFEALAIQGALAIERARLREEHERSEHAARRRLETENAALRARIGEDAPVGESPPMRRALDTLRRAASSDVTVCLVGETGTGKEMMARTLHRLSPRAGGPFVVVDCGVIPEGLVESELFGHEKGAFTGAGAAREGRFREAEGGTVFLDEIGELSLPLQTRLLRVLQERTVQPVGAAGRVPVDVRVVCATHRDPALLVTAGRLREDLYYRISALLIPVPPLRERGEDVLLLANHFLSRFAAAYGTSVQGYTREAIESLLAHRWPGNVRELENRVQRAALLARGPYATRHDLGLGPEGAEESGGAPEAELPHPALRKARLEAMERFERIYLETTLRRTSGNVTHAARLAGVSRQTIQSLLRRHVVDPRRFTPKRRS
jgi:two-component system, NtrC family, response regulator